MYSNNLPLNLNSLFQSLQVPSMFQNIPFSNIISMLLDRLRLGPHNPVGSVGHPAPPTHRPPSIQSNPRSAINQAPPGVPGSSADTSGIRPFDPILDAGYFLNPNKQLVLIGGKPYISDNPSAFAAFNKGAPSFAGQTQAVNIIGSKMPTQTPQTPTETPADLAPGTPGTLDPNTGTILGMLLSGKNPFLLNLLNPAG